MSDEKISLSINEFIYYEFTIKNKMKVTDIQSVNVICGDSNITVEKNNKEIEQQDTGKVDPHGNKIFEEIPLTRDILGKRIAAGLNSFFYTYQTEWLVLMSSNPIIKNRRGFVLKNQQLGKSLSEMESDKIGEADGTILAIKIFTKNKPKIISNWIAYFKNDNIDYHSNEFVIYCKENSYPVDNERNTYFLDFPKTFFGLDKDKKEKHFREHHAFNFKVESKAAMTKRNRPREKIFLDHSVLYTELDILNIYIKKDICFTYEEYFSTKPIQINSIGQQLIVLNLNSMINTTSSWNLDVKDHLSEINELDEVLFNIMKSNILKKNNTGASSTGASSTGASSTGAFSKEYTQINTDLSYNMFSGKESNTLFVNLNLKDDEFNRLNKEVKEAFDVIKKKIIEDKARKEQDVKDEKKRLKIETSLINKEEIILEEKEIKKVLEDKKKEEIELTQELQNLQAEQQKLYEATKYLKKGYYEKYIKYKTKYLNLKNT
jgi:hypothetical protein